MSIQKRINVTLSSILTALLVFSVAYTFWWYSSFRTLIETVGIHLETILLSIAYSLFFLFPVMVFITVVLSGRFREIAKRYFAIFIVVGMGLFGFIIIQFIPLFILGFHINYIITTLTFLTFFILTPLIALVIVVVSDRFREVVKWHLIVLVMVGGGLVGSIIGESAILFDEASFRREVKQAKASGFNQYGRSRAWPNGTASLVWNRDSGIHATD